MDLTWTSRIRKHAPRWLVLAGMIALVVHYLGQQPSTVDVTYRLGGASRGLLAARIFYQQGEAVERTVQYSYGRQSAPTALRHQVQLSDGDYRVRLELDYAAAPGNRLGGEIKHRSKNRVTLSLDRPLLVRGSAPATIYVADE
jgi:hypothetical protein